ncbi:MAG TPA: FAD-dependent monooxygenase [Stellaceae bacterium]|nr:FAD-dependent monooxygenase [Stellaceae bacterium]
MAHPVLIVGGGIAGLTLAAALRRQGIAADVVEREPAWNILGVGISLTGPTLRALQSIGLLDACVAVAFGFDRIVFADAHGVPSGALALPRLCGPDHPATVAIGRPALHEVLLRAAEAAGARVRLGVTVTALVEQGDGIEAAFSDGTRGRYRLVAGCDGIHSAVRAMAFDSVPPARFTGLAVWRAAMARPPEVTSMQMFFGPRTKAGVNPHAPDAMFLFLVQPIADAARLPPERLHLVLQEQLADFDGAVMQHVRRSITDPRQVDYRPMDAFLLPAPWHRGRIVVLGDAAHTTTPHLATGAGIAIEDAVVLAELLGAGLDTDEALARFMARRFERCRLVVETAVRLGEMEKDPAIPIQAHLDLMTDTFRRLAAPI